MTEAQLLLYTICQPLSTPSISGNGPTVDHADPVLFGWWSVLVALIQSTIEKDIIWRPLSLTGLSRTHLGNKWHTPWQHFFVVYQATKVLKTFLKLFLFFLQILNL